MVSRYRYALILASPVIGILAPPRGRGADGIDHAATYDCGTLALYTLLSLEGRPADLRALERALPPPNRQGFSLADLRRAAGVSGLSVRGVKLRSDQPLERPALAFVKRGQHGHYLVIRPVGHTGKLVQTIDPSGEVDVIEAADLCSRPEWTGLALVPDRPNWVAILAGALSVGSLSIGVAAWLVRSGVMKGRGGFGLRRKVAG
jgi:hypothetical protein